jgi:hypothetical protein
VAQVELVLCSKVVIAVTALVVETLHRELEQVAVDNFLLMCLLQAELEKMEVLAQRTTLTLQ